MRRNPSPAPSPHERGRAVADISTSPPFPEGEGKGEGLRVGVVSWTPLWQKILADLAGGADAPLIAAKFHSGLAATVAETAARLAQRHGCKTVVLCGGVFQNKLMLEGVTDQLAALGLQALGPEKFPAGDGAIALGQAIIAAARCLAPAA